MKDAGHEFGQSNTLIGNIVASHRLLQSRMPVH